MTHREIPLSCGDYAFPLLEHRHAMELVAMLGFRHIDLAVMGNRSHVRPEHVRGDVAGWAERIGAQLAAAGLVLSDVFLIPWTDFETLAPNHPDAEQRTEARALFEDVLELAARLGSPGLTLLPGIVWPGCSERESLERAGEELQWRAERAAARGLGCSIEPHIGSIADTPEAVLALLELAPDLRLALDPTHFVARDVAHERIYPLVPHARHFHARGARSGLGQCAVKDNVVDYGRFVDELEACGYEGAIAVEYVWIEWERMNECDNVSETILMRDQLRALLARGHDEEQEANR